MPGTNRPYNVLLIEDDPYARDVMMMLLVRDWRTTVTGEVTSKGGLHRARIEAATKAGAAGNGLRRRFGGRSRH